MELPEFTIDELLHYASANYDPQKAHEYYLQNRELSGRHSTKGFNQKQREGLSYAKNQIQGNKKAKLESARATEKQSIEQVRAEASAVRQQITEKLKAFAEALSKQHADNALKISENAKQQKQAIADKLASDIAALPIVPKGLSSARREKLLNERSAKIAELRGKADTDRSAVDAGTASDRSSERTSVSETRKATSDDAASQRAQVANQLKDVVAKYVEQYRSSKVQITSESAATLDKEYQNIKTKVR